MIDYGLVNTIYQRRYFKRSVSLKITTKVTQFSKNRFVKISECWLGLSLWKSSFMEFCRYHAVSSYLIAWRNFDEVMLNYAKVFFCDITVSAASCMWPGYSDSSHHSITAVSANLSRVAVEKAICHLFLRDEQMRTKIHPMSNKLSHWPVVYSQHQANNTSKLCS